MIALCLGGAATVWADLERATALIGDGRSIVVATNFAGISCTCRLDAWVTLHPEMATSWRKRRSENGLNSDYRFFTHVAHPGLDSEVIPHGWYGSSGLYAAQVSLEALEADGVILCGVPMQRDARHIYWPGRWQDVERYRPGFAAAQRDGANIKSMGGWTADLLGRPDSAWIAAFK